MVMTYEELQRENALLKAKIEWLTRQLFGTGKSEKIDRDQLLIELDDLRRQQEAQTESLAYERRKPQPKEKQPAAERFKDLPVDEVVEIVPEEVRADPELYEQIGLEETFEVDVQPPRLFKRVIRRLKYAHKLDRSRPPVVAPAPKRPVEGGYASAGLLVWVILSKYLDHLPLYRQEKMFARWGAEISRQVMADWIRMSADWLEPIYRYMRMEILQSGYVQADETPVRFHDPDQKKGKTVQGYLWVIHRPGFGVVFSWRLSRRHAEATTLLEGFAGVMQTDGYEAYHALARSEEGIIHAGCWAHARRGFFNARSEKPREAGLILGLIGKLYDLEEHYRKAGITGEERRQRRNADQRRILKWLKIAIRISQQRSLPQSTLGKACGYALARWRELTVYLDHGQVEIDNNLVENKIRPSAIGKKNWLFIGAPEAGKRTAILYSILLSCEIHGVDPAAYLRDVLTRLPAMTNQDDIRPLVPGHWQPAS
jgi:transposase